MEIKNDFEVHAPIDTAWAVLTDLELVAPCMPGASLTGRDGEDYIGKVKVRVGPATSEFKGVARFSSLEPENYAAVITAKGSDTRGAGNASATVSASLTANGDNLTTVHVLTDMQIAGKLAQFGSGMIQQVSEKLLAEFTRRLEVVLDSNSGAETTDGTAATAPADGASAAAVPADTMQTSPAASETVSEESASEPAVTAPPGPAPEVPAAPEPASAAAPPSVEEEPGVPANFTYVPEVPGEPYKYALTSASAGRTTHWSARTPASDTSTTGTSAPSAPDADDERGEEGDTVAETTSVQATAVETGLPEVAEQVGEEDGGATSDAEAAADRPRGAPARKRVTFDDDDGEALDLMKYAGGSIAKRVAPIVVGVAVVVVLVLLLVVVF